MRRRFSPLRVFALLLMFGCTSPAWAILFYTFLPSNGAGKAVFAPPRPINPADIAVPPGYCIEPVVTGLTYPTAVITDELDHVYILESGYSYGEDFIPPRLLRLESDGRLAVIATGDPKAGPWTGMSYHQRVFYVVLRITIDGKIATLVDGLPSMGDHHANRAQTGYQKTAASTRGKSEKTRKKTQKTTPTAEGTRRQNSGNPTERRDRPEAPQRPQAPRPHNTQPGRGRAAGPEQRRGRTEAQGQQPPRNHPPRPSEAAQCGGGPHSATRAARSASSVTLSPCHARSGHAERAEQSPAEVLTGAGHAHWLALLGFCRFVRN